MSHCIFCDIMHDKLQRHLIYEDDNHIAILDKYPIDLGHSLVIPKKPYEKLTDMNSTEIAELFIRIPKIVHGILKATNADAFTIVQNNGKSAKQIVPHVHVHIIPRYANKGTVWTKRGIPTDLELKELSKKIKTNFVS